jgi:hypothetical protein
MDGGERFCRAGDPEVFGGGDCIHFRTAPWTGGVYAVRANPVLRDKILSFSTIGRCGPSIPARHTYLLIYNLATARPLPRGACFRAAPLAPHGYRDRRFLRNSLP